MFLAPAVAAAAALEYTQLSNLPGGNHKKVPVGAKRDAILNADSTVGSVVKSKPAHDPHRPVVDGMAVVPYSSTRSDSYDESIDLRAPRAIVPANTRNQVISTVGNKVHDLASTWLAAQLERGATIIGDLIYDAAGKLIGRLSGKTKQEPMARKQNKKGTVATKKMKAMPVYSKPVVVKAPVNISRRVMVKSKPKITSGKKGLVITHREMIGQIISSGTTLGYKTDAFVINPGKYATFPWLSNIAGNFDKYIMRKLRFYTISNQATSVAGRVGLGYDVDSTDIAPADRNEFFALTYHSECAPWDTVTLDIPLDQKERFVNSHTTSDSKLIDIGQVILMSDAVVATNTALSDVIVEYTVELMDPQQAIYSTQYVAGANFSGATLDLLSTHGPVVVQLAGSGFRLQSTSTILYCRALQGYYAINLFTRDAAGGTPGLALAVNGGTGRVAGAVNSTIERMIMGVAKVTTNDAFFRITFSSVAPADLELINFQFTRIPAAVYVKMLSDGIFNADMTTF